MNRAEHISYNKSRMVICGYCQGSGQKIEYNQFVPNESKVEDCPKCKGEGVILQSINIVTRPITSEDKVFFRKIING